MSEQTSQGGNSHPEHTLQYKAELTSDRQYRVECVVCGHYIRLTLTNFFELQQKKQTYQYFEAMAGECRGAGSRNPLITFIAHVLEIIRLEPDEAKAAKQMEALKDLLRGASR